MPRYEFLCEKCQKPFELTMTISEHEKGKVRCPRCKSTNVTPQFGRQLREENRKLEPLVADLTLDKQILRDAVGKRF